VVALVPQRVANGLDAAALQDPHHRRTAAARGLDRVENDSELLLHVEELAAGVVRLRAADCNQDAQRCGNTNGKARAFQRHMAVEIDPGMQGERPGRGTRWAQPLPRKIDQLLRHIQGQLQ